MSGSPPAPVFDLAPLRLSPPAEAVERARRAASGSPTFTGSLRRRVVVAAAASAATVLLVLAVTEAVVAGSGGGATALFVVLGAGLLLAVLVAVAVLVVVPRVAATVRFRHHARWSEVAAASGATADLVAVPEDVPALLRADGGPLGLPPWRTSVKHRDVLQKTHGGRTVRMGTRVVRGRSGPHGVRSQTIVWAAVAVPPSLPAAYLHVGPRAEVVEGYERIVSRDATHTLYAAHDRGVSHVITDAVVAACALDRPRVSARLSGGWLVLAASGGDGAGHAYRVVEALEAALDALGPVDVR